MDSKDLAYEQAKSYRETLDELWARIDGDVITCPNDDHDSCNTLEEAENELNELPLEVVWETGEPFAVILGTGGPHVEITGGGRDGGYQLTVYWGGDRVTMTGESITRTGEYFRELVEES